MRLSGVRSTTPRRILLKWSMHWCPRRLAAAAARCKFIYGHHLVALPGLQKRVSCSTSILWACIPLDMLDVIVVLFHILYFMR